MNPLNLNGIHHITAITHDAERIYRFYTNILGMRLVKKNVNQDDLTSYHLFFGDDRGNPGTEMTFFDFKGLGPVHDGNDTLSRTSFRVPSHEALLYWERRLTHYKIKHTPVHTQFGCALIEFKDFDNHAYALISDEGLEGVLPGEPWHQGPVPDVYAIVGLGPVTIRVRDYQAMDAALTLIFKMRYVCNEGSEYLYEMGLGGNGGRVIVEKSTLPNTAIQGYGAIHHVAFRVANREALMQWIEWFKTHRIPNSGFVDRYYFKSLYVRVYPNILFEIATDGPGFIDDQESYEVLGETLTLPPHLRHKRDSIAQHLKPFDSVRSTIIFKKEVF